MSAASESSRETILVVDDNPITRLGLAELFRDQGFGVVECGDGAECREALRADIPDLLLLDVQLPDVNGMDLCREFKTDERLATLFICLISSSVIEPDQQIEGLDVGADSYIVRPIPDRELLARIEALFRIVRAEHALREANEALEHKVAARTADLAKANTALLEEVRTRRDAEMELQRLNLRLQGLHSIDQAILQSLSARNAAHVATESIRRLLPVPLTEVWTLQGEPDGFTCLTGADGDTDRTCALDGVLFDLLDQIVNGKSLQLSHAASPFGGVEPWKQLAIFPLVAAEQIVGVLLLGSNEPLPLSQEELVIGNEIASSLAVTLNLANLFIEVNEGRERTRRLSRRVLDIQEEERRFLSRELHDEIGQHLTGMKAMLDASIKRLADQDTEELRRVVQIVNDLMSQVRQLSINLRPQMLDELGLIKALEWQLTRVKEQSHTEILFSHNEFERLPPHIEIAVFRIVQEALTNVTRHAQNASAEVRLFVDDDRCRIQIQDSGPGFDANAKLNAMRTAGLSGMTERAALLGGELIIESEPGNGACLTADLPLTIASASAENP
jgi:signal transduction histidine kinase